MCMTVMPFPEGLNKTSSENVRIENTYANEHNCTRNRMIIIIPVMRVQLKSNKYNIADRRATVWFRASRMILQATQYAFVLIILMTIGLQLKTIKIARTVHKNHWEFIIRSLLVLEPKRFHAADGQVHKSQNRYDIVVEYVDRKKRQNVTKNVLCCFKTFFVPFHLQVDHK